MASMCKGRVRYNGVKGLRGYAVELRIPGDLKRWLHSLSSSPFVMAIESSRVWTNDQPSAREKLAP